MSFLQPVPHPHPLKCQVAPESWPDSQDTLSVMVLLTSAPGKVTRQVRLVPWSCGRGLNTISGDLEAAEPSAWGLKAAAPIQEKVLGRSGAQAPGREHTR